MMKIKVAKASAKVRFRKLLGGSVLKGTVFCRWDGVDTHRLSKEETNEKSS